MRIQTHRDEGGIALLVAVMLLLMVSAIGLAALQSSQGEASSAGKARRKTMTSYAAEAGLELFEQQLGAIGGVGSVNVTLPPINFNNFLTDDFGGTTAIRSGNSETVAAQPIPTIGNVMPEGEQLNVGSRSTFHFAAYRTNIVATDPGQGVAEIQGQYRVLLGSNTY